MFPNQLTPVDPIMDLVDSGLACNTAFTPLLRSHRRMDLILSLNYSWDPDQFMVHIRQLRLRLLMKCRRKLPKLFRSYGRDQPQSFSLAMMPANCWPWSVDKTLWMSMQVHRLILCAISLIPHGTVTEHIACHLSAPMDWMLLARLQLTPSYSLSDSKRMCNERLYSKGFRQDSISKGDITIGGTEVLRLKENVRVAFCISAVKWLTHCRFSASNHKKQTFSIHNRLTRLYYQFNIWTPNMRK